LPRVLLTEIVARNIKPTSKRFTVWDTSLPGFGLRVSARTKTWTVMLDRQQRRRISVGRYPAMTLKDARIEARRLIDAPEANTRRPVSYDPNRKWPALP
jgi:hypothetical protein